MFRLALFISGRGSNMSAIVQSCQSGLLQNVALPVLVFSNKEQAEGLKWAQENKINTLCIPSKGKTRADFDAEVLAAIRPYHIDYILLAGYMRVVSPLLVDAFPGKIINIHPADTKEHQGMDGYAWAWEQKKDSTKITVHYVDYGLDTGDIIAQAEIDMKNINSLEDLERNGLKQEHQLYSQALYQVFTQSIQK